MTYLGFDTYACPTPAQLVLLRQKFDFLNYYLRAPSNNGARWKGRRDALVKQGWGIWPIYVGQQLVGPGSHSVNPTQGTLDGHQAVQNLKEEGFAPDTILTIDLENGLPFPDAEKGYIQNLSNVVRSAGYRPGIYCSFQFAARAKEAVPDANIWVYHVPSVNYSTLKGPFPTPPDPTTSGYAGADLWQFRDETMLPTMGGLVVDFDSSKVQHSDTVSSHFPTPSIDTPVLSTPAVTVTTGYPAGSVQEYQHLLNLAGCTPPLVIDGVNGLRTQMAVFWYQLEHGLLQDGVVSPQTISSLRSYASRI